MTAYDGVDLVSDPFVDVSATEILRDHTDGTSSTEEDSLHVCPVRTVSNYEEITEWGEASAGAVANYLCQCCKVNGNLKNLPSCCLQPKHEALQQELDRERNAAEVAANEAISMILRLQVEKAALQLQARHYSQMLEAQNQCYLETVSELKDFISSQEEDKQMLEEQINEYGQLLRQYNIHMPEKGRRHSFSSTRELPIEPKTLFGNDKCLVSAMVSTCNDEMVDCDPVFEVAPSDVPVPESGKWLKPFQAEEDYDVSTRQPESIMPSTLDITDEATTKHVVCISKSSSTYNLRAENSNFKDLPVPCSPDQGFSDFNPTEDCNDSLDHILDVCGKQILKQLSNMQKQIQRSRRIELIKADKRYRSKDQNVATSLDLAITKLKQDISRGYADFVKASLANTRFCEENEPSQKCSRENADVSLFKTTNVATVEEDVNFKDTKTICGQLIYDTTFNGKEASSASELCSDRETEILNCLSTLEENLLFCQRQTEILESSRKATRDAVQSIKENKGKTGAVMGVASNLFKEFLSFTSLSCSMLEVLDRLTKHINHLVKEMDESQVVINDSELSKDGESPKFSTSQDETNSSEESDSTVNVLSYLWSIGLQWANNEKCRAETAFCGWDY